MSDLRALAEKATPGPWGDPTDVNYGDFGYYVYGCPAGETEDSLQGQADIAYIAAAHPQAILALLDELARYRRARQEMGFRRADLSFCIKDDDCGIKAQGAALAIADFDHIVGVVAE